MGVDVARWLTRWKAARARDARIAVVVALVDGPKSRRQLVHATRMSHARVTQALSGLLVAGRVSDDWIPPPSVPRPAPRPLPDPGRPTLHLLESEPVHTYRLREQP